MRKLLIAAAACFAAVPTLAATGYGNANGCLVSAGSAEPEENIMLVSPDGDPHLGDVLRPSRRRELHGRADDGRLRWRGRGVDGNGHARRGRDDGHADR